MNQNQQTPRDVSNRSRSSFEEVNTIQMEHERLRQIVLTFIGSRCETDRLGHEARLTPPDLEKKLKGNDKPEIGAQSFQMLPRGMYGHAAPHWLILFDSLGAHPPIGIEIVSDVVMGVTRGMYSAADFDFTPYNGVDMGVSRRHAMLRPSTNHLYIIDLGSTNGTRLNGMQLESNRPSPINNGDMISLGALTFCVEIIASPSDYNAAQNR